MNLAQRVAARASKTAGNNTTIQTMKLAWANQVAEAMALRFENYGGWRDYEVTTNVRHRMDGALVELTSKQGWSASVIIDVEDAASMQVSMYPQSKPSEDLLESLMKLHKESEVLPIKDTDSVDDAVMAASLWLSKQLNKANL